MKRFAITGLGLMAILALTLAAHGLPVLDSVALMFNGALGDWLGITRTLVKAVPLTITALGIAVAWRSGMYNIGGEGQFTMGGVTAAVIGAVLNGSEMPGWIGISLLVAASLIGGSLWGWVAAWLRVKRNVDVVIATILLNFIALQILAWVVAGPLKDPHAGTPLTTALDPQFMLTRVDRQSDLHAGALLALAAVAFVLVYLFLTPAGLRLRVVGEGERAARANGIAPDPIRFQAMLVSGGLCGLAGGIEYLGISGQLGKSFAQGWGFLAIPVALIGGLHPGGVALSALYFAAVIAGSRNLGAFTAQGPTLVYIIQAAAVLGLIALGTLRFRKHPTAEAA